MKLEEILDAAILIGYHLLCNGADVSRVEQSIDYICEAYGAREINAFAIPSSIVVTISNDTMSLTKTKRILKQQTNLDCVEKIAGLSRYICAAKPTYLTIVMRMDEILATPRWNIKWQYVAHMLTGASFCIFFGGNFFDSLIAAAIGALLMSLNKLLEKINANNFFVTVICSFFAAFISGKMGVLFHGYFHTNAITIGDIMLLVPGLALANSMRDFIANDTMTGLSRITEALFVAIGVALGVACAMFFL
ncbi:MAG: threonine/serine exporter ThrE family protein [Velocimicrobium sp.]